MEDDLEKTELENKLKNARARLYNRTVKKMLVTIIFYECGKLLF